MQKEPDPELGLPDPDSGVPEPDYNPQDPRAEATALNKAFNILRRALDSLGRHPPSPDEGLTYQKAKALSGQMEALIYPLSATDIHASIADVRDNVRRAVDERTSTELTASDIDFILSVALGEIESRLDELETEGDIGGGPMRRPPTEPPETRYRSTRHDRRDHTRSRT